MKSRVVKGCLTAIVAGVAFVLVVGTVYINPFGLLRSEESLRSWMLRITPIGMNMEEVIGVIEEKNNWRIMSRSYEYGYTDAGYPPVGEKHIIADLGKGGIFWYKYASWGFDADGILIDVYVSKATSF